jgi:hypothetical protein
MEETILEPQAIKQYSALQVQLQTYEPFQTSTDSIFT